MSMLMNHPNMASSACCKMPQALLPPPHYNPASFSGIKCSNALLWLAQVVKMPVWSTSICRERASKTYFAIELEVCINSECFLSSVCIHLKWKTKSWQRLLCIAIKFTKAKSRLLMNKHIAAFSCTDSLWNCFINQLSPTQVSFMWFCRATW